MLRVSDVFIWRCLSLDLSFILVPLVKVTLRSKPSSKIAKAVVVGVNKGLFYSTLVGKTSHIHHWSLGCVWLCWNMLLMRLISGTGLRSSMNLGSGLEGVYRSLYRSYAAAC